MKAIEGSTKMEAILNLKNGGKVPYHFEDSGKLLFLGV
jgi:hypothetical protein